MVAGMNGCLLHQMVLLDLVWDHFWISGVGSLIMKFLHAMSVVKLESSNHDFYNTVYCATDIHKSLYHTEDVPQVGSQRKSDLLFGWQRKKRLLTRMALAARNIKEVKNMGFLWIKARSKEMSMTQRDLSSFSMVT